MTADIAAASKQFMRVAEGLPRLLTLSDGTVEIMVIHHEMQEPGADLVELGERLAEAEAFEAQKLDSCAWTVRDLERFAEIRIAEGKRLIEQGKTLEQSAERLRMRMLEHMEAVGDERITTERFTISIRLNPPSVAVLEDKLVPGEFQRVIPARVEVDKKAILQWHKQTGETPAGVDIVRTTRLAIE